jgi:D-sedoheptulose 7-phosphate isomerase
VTGQSSLQYDLTQVPGFSLRLQEILCVDRSNPAPSKCALGPLTQTSQEYYAAYQEIVAGLPFEEMDKAVNEIMSAYERNASVFTLGNGGSAALASHFACDLGKGTLIKHNTQKRFRVISLVDNVPLITAWANDQGFEHVFAQQLENLLVSGDLVFAISGSGNSANVLRALEAARRQGARTIGLAGFEGGKMKRLCDVCIIVPSDYMQIIEDFQLSATHAITSVIRRKISDAVVGQKMAATVMAD